MDEPPAEQEQGPIGQSIIINKTQGDTLLHRMLAFGRVDMFFFLVESGANTDLLNRRGLTPLGRLLRVDSPHSRAALHLIIDHAPSFLLDHYMVNPYTRTNILHAILESWELSRSHKMRRCLLILKRVLRHLRNQNPDLLQQLLGAPNKPTKEYPDGGGYTPLHLAVMTGFLDAIEELIDFGADPLSDAFLGYSPVFLAETRD